MTTQRKEFERSNRDVYPLTWTVEGALEDSVGKTFMIHNESDGTFEGIDIVRELFEYIGEIEHDPSLLGDELQDIRLNGVAGILTDFTKYLVLRSLG